jgi:4-amino-4-deoxy-L-arabinose transferase-like glycosyltransferase
MSVAESPRAGYRLNKIKDSLNMLHERARDRLPARWLILLIGIGCVAYSQYLMEQRALQGPPLPLAEEWNILYRLEIVNFSNVLLAIPYFLGGVILCAWAGLPASWKEPFVNWSEKWPALAETEWGKHLPRLLVAVGLVAFLLIQLGKHQYMPIYPFLWIVALWLFTLTVWNWDRDKGTNLSLELKPIDIFWLLALLALGIGIGAYALWDIPAIMIPDEGSFWENARAIATKDFRPAFFDSGVYTFPVATSIYQGWILRLFGLNLWGWRFSSVLAGVAAVIPLYLLGKEWFDRRVAVASVVFMLANPYFLSFARLGYNNSQSLFPTILAIYFWALGSRKGSYLYLWLAGLTAGLGFYTYSAVWIGIVTMWLGIVYLRILKQISWRQSLAVLVLILLAWGAAFAPRLVYTASGESKHGLIYKIYETSFFNVFYGKAYYGEAELTRTMPLIERSEYPTIFYDPLVYQELLTRGLVRTLVALFDPYLISEHFLISALAGVITPVFFGLGFFLFLRRWKQARFGLPLIWLISGLIFLSIIAAFPPRHTHMVSLIPAIALVSAAGLSAIVETLTEHLPSSLISFRGAAISALVAVVLLTVLYAGVKKYFVTMPETFPPSFEDFASWVAWRTEKPSELIYIGPTDIAHRLAYVVTTRMVPHTYRNVDPAAFSPEIDLRPDTQTILFWETNTKEGIPHLQQPPVGFGAPVAFLDKAGNVLGYTMTNASEVPLQWQAELTGGWNSIEGPARNILLVLLFSMLLVGIVTLRSRFVWPRFSFETGKQLQQTEADEPTVTSDTFEIEFHFRVRFPSRRKNSSQ